MAHIDWEHTDENGDEDRIIKVPAKYVVCERCDGEGKHSNPSIDGNGITSDEWAEWDDEDKETYLSGGYDVTCEACKGVRVVLEADYDVDWLCGDDLKREYAEDVALKLKWKREEYEERRRESMMLGKDC